MVTDIHDHWSFIPINHLGAPEEISNIVIFLASDESSFSTGSEFIDDGCETAWADPEI